MRVPTRRSEIGKSRSTDYHLTPAAIKKMQRELEELVKVKHPAAADEVRRTGMFGDFSENAEYQYAKGVMRRMLRRIDYLKDMLAHAIPIVADAAHTGRVVVGTTVTLSENGRQVKYSIVGAQESDPAKGRISHLSPLGDALLGHVVGESIVHKTSKGELVYKIVNVELFQE